MRIRSHVSGAKVKVVLVLVGLVALGTPAASAAGGSLQDKIDELKALLVGHEARRAADDAALAAEVANIEAKLDFLHVDAEATDAFAAPGDPPVPPDEALFLVRVTWKGAGVTGLAAAAFDVATHLVPPGNCDLEVDSHSDFGNGDYALRVTPIDLCNWGSGDYLSAVIVTSGGLQGSDVVKRPVG